MDILTSSQPATSQKLSRLCFLGPILFDPYEKSLRSLISDTVNCVFRGRLQPATITHTMPSDEYASAGGGALRIKGAKVKKHKKKKAKSDLEKNLSTGEPSSSSSKKDPTAAQEDADEHAAAAGGVDDDDDARKGEARRGDGYEGPSHTKSRKTEAERRFEEVRRKKLLELSESAGSRPELLKTHKERVEELNTYLSKLSEHHDMPKIGPG